MQTGVQRHRHHREPQVLRQFRGMGSGRKKSFIKIKLWLMLYKISKDSKSPNNAISARLIHKRAVSGLGYGGLYREAVVCEAAVSLAQSHRKSSVMAGWCAAVPLEAWMQLLLTVEAVPTLGSRGHCASSFTSTSDLYSGRAPA